MKTLPIDKLIDTLRLQSPIIGFCNPQIELLNHQQCKLRIPLTQNTKSHINSLGFGPLAIGADLTGGLLVLYCGQSYDKTLDFCFSKAEISFLRKPMSDVFFVCQDGEKIKNTLNAALELGVAQTVDLNIAATIHNGLREKIVAKFILNLFVRMVDTDI